MRRNALDRLGEKYGKVSGDVGVLKSVGEVWKSVWGECGKVCWSVGGDEKKGMGGVEKLR